MSRPGSQRRAPRRPRQPRVGRTSSAATPSPVEWSPPDRVASALSRCPAAGYRIRLTGPLCYFSWATRNFAPRGAGDNNGRGGAGGGRLPRLSFCARSNWQPWLGKAWREKRKGAGWRASDGGAERGFGAQFAPQVRGFCYCQRASATRPVGRHAGGCPSSESRIETGAGQGVASEEGRVLLTDRR